MLRQTRKANADMQCVVFRGSWIARAAQGSLFTFALCILPFAFTIAASPLAFSAAVRDDGGMTEAKALYASGRYVEALGKFTTILRSDPRNDEARQYLRLIVDNMKKPAAVSKKNGKTPAIPAVVPYDLQKRLLRRELLAVDLATIPDVHILQRPNGSEADLPSDFLFGDKLPGLKEQGIPLLDRVAAWLRTFDQPIIIHCYPEELDDPAKNGRLFLRRYAELYSFFTEEKKLNPSRFLSTEDLDGGNGPDKEEVAKAPKGSRVVIEIIGIDYPYQDGLLPPEQRSTPWLENSVTAKPLAINPREGESSTIDLAALARMGVRKWSFTIAPQASPTKTILTQNGAGNLLKRVRWDGRDAQSGTFMAPGAYVAQLTATNNDGHTLTKEIQITILSVSGAAPAAVSRASTVSKHAVKKLKPKIKKPAAAAVKKAAAPAPVEVAKSTPEAAEAAPAEKEAPEKAAAPPAAEAQEETEATSAAETNDSAHAIWKQVIQFDANESSIKASLRASLERIGKTLEVYPLQKVRIVGVAGSEETDAANLAKKRAETVRSILIQEYQVDAKRVIVAPTKVSGKSGRVELSITN
jgi:outer membrane protein OmpA-like peptidoglycan-associated protein